MQESGGNQYRIFPSPAKLGGGARLIAAPIENRGGGPFLDLNSGRAEGFTPTPALPAVAGGGRASIRVLVKNRLDRAGRQAVVLLQKFLGRGEPARDAFFERAQIARLVAAVAVELLPAGEPARGQGEGGPRTRQPVLSARLRA